jgi:hypothetical protein
MSLDPGVVAGDRERDVVRGAFTAAGYPHSELTPTRREYPSMVKRMERVPVKIWIRRCAVAATAGALAVGTLGVPAQAKHVPCGKNKPPHTNCGKHKGKNKR